MTWVKICGITNLEDALTAVDAGADALGFVFYEKSPRHITQEAAHDIVRQLPVKTKIKIERVGVFVDESLSLMEEVAQEIGLTGIQAHLNLARLQQAEHTLLVSKMAKYIVLRAADLTGAGGLPRNFTGSRGTDTSVRAIFLDAGTQTQPGGTGKVFDWQSTAPTVRALQQDFRIVVAGGLTPTNVPEAMRILNPWGVDVSTGVEARPGRKDAEKVRAFVAAVRRADQKA
jgi:phosphoribosylanthranilate isomerase